MVKKIALGFVVLVLLLVVLVATRPSEYRVSRAMTIQAPPDEIFDKVNHLLSWEAWSPWTKLDPAIKQTYEGPESGVGARYSWTGNNDVGEGRMTITESRPHEWVQLKLEFFKPMAGEAITDFEFVPQDQGTRVTWTMFGTNNFVGKAFSLIMDMDSMIGSQFEEGLANLNKSVTQTDPK